MRPLAATEALEDPQACAALAARLRAVAAAVREDVAHDTTTRHDTAIDTRERLRLADDTDRLGTSLGEYARCIRAVTIESAAAQRSGAAADEIGRMRHRAATDIGKARNRLRRAALLLA